MSAASTPRTPRFDLPPAPTYSTSSATSDNGLAEWTSKIRAMQRQVDADEEAEQRRLEEEIVRARLARMRRSRTGQSGDFGVGMHGIDLAKVQEAPTTGRTTDPEITAQSSEKQSKPNVSFPKPAIKTGAPASSGDKAPLSLAEFMGGSASGPRLKRHEPQVDASVAYDGRMNHGAVHPIFGRGGIAMPGMVGRGGATAASSTPTHSSLATSVAGTPRTAPSDLARSRTTSTSSVARRYVEKIEEQTTAQTQSPRLTGLGIRERRISIPAGSFSAELKVNTPAVSSRPLSQIVEKGTASPETRLKSPVTETRPKTPTAGEIRSKTPTTTEIRPKTPAAGDTRPKTPVAESRPKTPTIVEPRSKTPVGDSRAKTPNADNTWAKTPVQSQSPMRPTFSGATPWTPRHQPSSVPATVSNTVPSKSAGPPSPVRATYSPQPQRGASPAFLRPQMTSSMKDPTPSISRLQGRGFVQSMVLASGRLEAESQGSPSSGKSVLPSSSPSPAQGETRDKSARRASVLDRWQPGMNNSSSISTPSPPCKPSTPTRSHTVHAKAGQDVPVVKTHDTGRSVRSAVSLPAMPKTPLKKPDVLPGTAVDDKLGSSSTMISYIKPTKTGDDPVVPDVNELGVRTGVGDGRGVGAGAGVVHTKTPRVSASALPSSPGKPLSHPTKDRARKPRKARFEGEEPAASVEGATPSTSLPMPSTQASKPVPSPVSVAEPSAPSSIPNDTIPKAPADPPSRTRSDPGPQPRVTPPTPSGRVTDRWTEPTLIGVKPLPSPSAANKPPPSPNPSGITGMVGRRALPGLANPVVHAQNEKAEKEKPKEKEDRPVPPSLRPSTNTCESPARTDAPVTRPSAITGPSVEKRKSSYERYAAIVMPPLKEERTPVPTPANTVSKAAGEGILGSVVMSSDGPMGSLPDASGSSEPPSVDIKERTMIYVEHVDEALPEVDVEALLKVNNAAAFTPDPDLRTISVDVISVTTGSASPITRDTNIFYNTEVLVIVHRAKSRESGLATTRVWSWRGKKSRYGEREEKKIAELARRYNTSAEVVYQQREPAELVGVLGGQLAIRQGTRNHWSSENTTMHVIRSSDGHILIDEADVNIRNLCSGYSYCISILDSTYVWYGCGSVPAEREAALEYARGMATSITELTEGENDAGDEMFWMVVGDPSSYAKADYWKWRSTAVPSEPRCWIVDLGNSGAPVRSVPTLSAETMLQNFVYIVDCSWEFFVLVGKHARAKRSDIMLAVNTVMAMSKHVATSKPFSPTVHVLVIPTQLPLDMRLAFRALDESTLNGGFIPDHMNILSTTEAIEHLRTSSWEKSALKDHTMLPLGLDSSHVSLP
ncbi:hypothetical protein F5I97DRAFT_2002417 [Phlebopus sp. FC_14]|nr:hypothetical protein F5I97DRAFT_2002417 [Phlebopus sp. FC_14]